MGCPDTYCAGCGEPQSDDEGIECGMCGDVYCSKCAPTSLAGDHRVVGWEDEMLCIACIYVHGEEE